MKVIKLRFKIVYYAVVFIAITWYLLFSFRDFGKHAEMIPGVIYPSEYKSLLRIRDTSEISIVTSYNSKYRYPITLLDYKKKYTLIVYKITDKLKVPITEMLQIKNKYSYEYYNTDYIIVKESQFEMCYSSDTTKDLVKISVNLSGDSITNTANSDTLISYYLKFSQISWSKNDVVHLDIYIEPNDPTPFANKIPASVAFIKRGNALYFILLSVNGYTSYFNKNILNKLLGLDQ